MDFAELTTLRLGGPARSVLEVTTEADLVDAVRVADEAGDPVLIVGRRQQPRRLRRRIRRHRRPRPDARRRVDTEDCDDLAGLCGGVMVTVQAGEDWDGLVARAVDENWRGVEALSGIPGTVGATPIQNVGAYGQEVSQTIAAVARLRPLRPGGADDGRVPTAVSAIARAGSSSAPRVTSC